MGGPEAREARTYWNYRVVRLEEDEYEVREVYYEADRIVGFTSATPAGGSPAELRVDLQHMLEALDRPVLRIADLWAQ